MNTIVLHYIYDPLCGWCYGAAPLVKAARAELRVIPHGGGMMTGARRQKVTPQLREFIKPHDVKIAQLSGQPFGENYVDGLLCDTNAIFDSEPPTAAMLSAEMLSGCGLDMLAQLQIAHYVEGRRIADIDVLVEVATKLGLDTTRFANTLESQLGEAVQAHVQKTRAFMASVGAQGFPSFVLEDKGEFQIVDVSPYLGRPLDLQTWLRSHRLERAR